MLRRLAVAGVVVGALVVAALPIVLTVAFHWNRTHFLASTLGPGSGILFLLALLYAVWLPGTVFGMVHLLDLLGVHYMPPQREKRPSRRERLRTRAAARYLQSQAAARAKGRGAAGGGGVKTPPPPAARNGRRGAPPPAA